MDHRISEAEASALFAELLATSSPDTAGTATGDAADGDATDDAAGGDSTESDEDFSCAWSPPKTPKSDKFLLEMTDKEWIHALMPWAIKNKVHDGPLLELLQTLVIKRKAKLSDITLSRSTIKRIREEEQRHAHLDVNFKEFDDFLTIHFDEKKVVLGANQGGDVKEHVAIIVTGVSGEQQLGIEIAENARGNVEMICE